MKQPPNTPVSGGLKTGNTQTKQLWESLHVQKRFRPQYPSERVVQFLAPRKGRLFDFGCGAGRHMRLGKELGYEVYGWDVSSVGRRHAKKWGDIRELSKIPDDFFDVIVSYGVLYYLSSAELDKVIPELQRVLKGQMLLVLRSTKDYRFKCSTEIGNGDRVVSGRDGRVANERGLLMHFFAKKEILSRFRGFSEVLIDEVMSTSDGGKYVDHDFVVQLAR